MSCLFLTSHDHNGNDADENDEDNNADDNYRTSHGGNRECGSPLPTCFPRQLVHDPVVQREVNAGLNIITSMTIELL